MVHKKYYQSLTRILPVYKSDRYEVKSQGHFDCISMTIKDGENFFKCFSAIQDSSIQNSLLTLYPNLNKVI